ncbi:hypothetical protein QE370_000578 [Aeromicrobium sp. SORGH_AS981]|jgi:CHAP domain|uniref:CHAP domain-containing protein n=1 Tax=Aeromicrobium sp. SORGH_AS_0981 TaxID=3041802 RepID=UPI00285D89C2|nr:CHAP domain-containing protein [Aeromicrobium sp. SORGH_AS_0981]MDR6117394.1 hypothetical protein [Aeromicrobium sp. SORGH_AS_0981]
MKRTRLAAAALTAAALLAGPAVAGSAQADTAGTSSTSSTTAISANRQAVVERAMWALGKPLPYIDRYGTKRNSTPVENRNLFEYGGSNTNKNLFNNYNGDEWCGYFAAWAWTNRLVPSKDDFPAIPRSYPASQSWADQTGSRFKPFSASSTARPLPGDVLVWKNNNEGGGHVGVVVQVNGNKIYTVEGNVGGDEIGYKYYLWDGDGPTINNKTFRGFTSAE